MCNKCVEKYDHHCAFMSTCVGRKNYKPFMVAITTAAIIGLYFAVVAIYGFIIFFTDRSLFYSSGSFEVNCSFENRAIAVKFKRNFYNNWYCNLYHGRSKHGNSFKRTINISLSVDLYRNDN